MARLIISLIAAIAGVAMLLGGLGVDAWLHAQDETLAAREGIFTLSNPGHVLLALGVATMCAGVFSAMHIAWSMARAEGILGRRWVRIIAMQAAGAASLGAVAFALAVSASGHDHADGASAAHAHADAPQHEHVNAPPEAALTLAAPAPALHAGAGEAQQVGPIVAAAHEHPVDVTASTAPLAVGPSAEAPPHAPHAESAPGTEVSPFDDDPHMHSDADPKGAGAGDKHPHNSPAPTAEELACLGGLTARAKAATARFADYAVAVAEGYRDPAEPGGTHYPSRRYMLDGATLALGNPESLIYRTDASGARALIGALYKAPRGEGPQPCGNATWWHAHDGCVDPAAGERTGMPSSGICPDGTVLRESKVEMMHLWFVPRKQR